MMKQEKKTLIGLDLLYQHKTEFHHALCDGNLESTVCHLEMPKNPNITIKSCPTAKV